MVGIWRKRLTNRGGMRVALAFLYLFATFGIGLSHTCQLADKDVHDHHSGCNDHLLHNKNNVEVQHTTSFNQNTLSEKTENHSLYCPECLYSLTFKAFRFYSNTSLYPTQIVTRTQFLPQLSFAKQLEWFCSVSLRAPPCVIS